MPVSYTYGLYPFAWNAATNCHEPPAGSACVLDLRPLSEQAKASQSGGYGLFAWPSISPPIAPPGDLVVLCIGYAPESAVDNAARNEFRIKLGLAANPSGATLADVMADVLGSLADPTGASMAKPIMPCRDGTMELHLAGHSRIWSAKVDAAELLSASPKGKHNRIRDVIRADLDEAERIGGASLMGKCLGARLLGLGFTREEIKGGASGKKSQWERLLSATVKAKHGANAKPREPSTSFAESWPNLTGDIESAAQDQSWTTLAVDSQNNTIGVTTGNLAYPSTNNSLKWGVCSSAVSSADHAVVGYCKGASGHTTILARASAATATAYGARIQYNANRKLMKIVAGVETLLGSPTGTPSGWRTVTCEPNGSTITHKTSGLADSSVTDTAITGLRGGIQLFGDSGLTYCQVGAWSIDDGLNPPVAAFSATPLTGSAPLSVAFTDASTNTPTSWLWERSSDGSSWSTFSTSQHPTASFSAGTWGVRLTATNAGGGDGETKLAYVVATSAGGNKIAGQYGMSLGIGIN